MHHEFEQLLEAQWSGRLDDAGQRRLSELCAADPARAERYHAEQRLSGLLAQCGPNHAPPDLAGRIMARLDTRIRVRPANSPANPWYAWVFQPALRTALAAMVLVAVGVEGGLLIADWRNRPAEQATADGPFIPPELRAPESSLPAVPAAGIRTDGDRQAAPRKGSHTPGRGNATVRPRPNPAQIAMAIPTSEFPAVSGPGLSSNDRILPGPSTNSPAAMPNNSPAASVPADGFGPAAPPAPLPQNPPVPLPPARTIASAEEMAKPAAPADRNVAMNIALNSAIMVTPDKAASPSPDLPWSSRTFVPPKDARPRPEALTHKEIEITIAEVEGDLITTNRMLDRPDAWQIKASMTPAQFREFAMKLRNYGIVPDPATLADTPELSKKMEDSSPRSSGNVYKITHGNTWLKPPVVFARQADGSGAAAGGAMGGVGTSRAPEKLTITIVVEQAEKR